MGMKTNPARHQAEGAGRALARPGGLALWWSWYNAAAMRGFGWDKVRS